jgi:hypothetical protein
MLTQPKYYPKYIVYYNNNNLLVLIHMKHYYISEPRFYVQNYMLSIISMLVYLKK